MKRWRKPLLLGGGLAGILILVGAGIYLVRAAQNPRLRLDWQWWVSGDEAARAALITTQRTACPGAPFILPADGFIGLLYGDPRGPYSQSRPHQGIDIFSDNEPGVIPVYAAYDGYISREPNWVSTLIQRVPDNPLQPGAQIWLYYTHMADAAGENVYIEPAFPPGTREKFVNQGTLLGYMGDYNGGSARRVDTHLHFSIVRDDGQGRYLNELLFDNTYDPSLFLGMAVNYACQTGPVICTATPTCPAAITPQTGANESYGNY